MLKNKIVKTELIEWRKLKWLQTNLKELKKDAFEKLKNSLKNNHFVMPFNVWDDGKDVWILDGHHRQKALEEIEKEGIEIPDKLPANFIECKNRKEASKLVLLYSSTYARITDEGLYEFLNLEDLKLEDLKFEIELPELDYINSDINDYLEKEFDENIETKNECPRCGYKWS